MNTVTKQNKPLDIVMLTTVRFHLAKGGTEKVMVETANALTQKGHHVTIIFRDKAGSASGFPLDSKVKLVNCASVKTPFWLASAICDIRSFSFSKRVRDNKRTSLNLKTIAYRFHEAINLNPADVYITYDPKLSAMLVREFNISQPVVTTFQFDPNHIIRRYNFESIKDLIAQAGPIQVLLPQFVQTIRSVLPQAKCVVIPNAVAQIRSCAKSTSSYILNIGRIMPLKNQLLLVKAMGIVNRQYPDWRVKIVGENHVDKDYTNQIKKFIHENKLQNIVELTGPSNDVEKEFLSSSIFVFSSTSEGFGLALAEAMSAGLPCIGLKTCSAVSCLIRNGENGLLCENTPESLAETIIRLIQDRDLRVRLGQQAKRDMKTYEPSAVWDQWEDFLYSLI